MSKLSSRAAVLAALFAAAQLAACGGNDNDPAPAPAPVASPAPSPAPTPPAPPPPPAAPVTTISPLKTLAYTVSVPNDGTTPAAAGQVSDPTANGATLSLGAPGQIVLTVDNSNGFVITTPDYYVFNRYAGSVLMLCDAATTPGSSTARFVAVSASVAEGGVAPEAVTSAAALAGMRFYKLSNCAYQSAAGSQDQDVAADADSLQLEFDSAGNATSNAMTMTFTAAEFSDMLANGTSVGGLGFTAWRFTIDGQSRIVLVERSNYDAVNQTPGTVQLWLPQ
jgi:uncharacterized repeat protein (TIGR01451 family)